MNSPIRAAIVCDYLEEGWASMDLTGEMILDHLAARPPGEVAATRVRPPWRHRAARFSGSGTARNVDRLLNRMVDYPRDLKRIAKDSPFDVYHIVDHSYSQLVHVLPAERTVVTCHDLDTFRCLLDPAAEPRPKWFRAMARRSLRAACKRPRPSPATARRPATPSSRTAWSRPSDCTSSTSACQPNVTPDPSPEFDAEADSLLGGPDGPTPP